jgi:lipopolysaccharide export LptBFGC system permease protein LptF
MPPSGISQTRILLSIQAISLVSGCWRFFFFFWITSEKDVFVERVEFEIDYF